MKIDTTEVFKKETLMIEVVFTVPTWDYSIKDVDPDRTAKASGRDLRVSLKAAREICHTIKGMMLKDAIEYLEAVIALKKPVPFKRYNKEIGHRRQLQKWHSGRYPVKAAKHILEVLRNVENNADYKGLDAEKCKIIHAAAQIGPKIKRYISRAFGRSSPKFQQLTHVEIIVEELLG